MSVRSAHGPRGGDGAGLTVPAGGPESGLLQPAGEGTDGKRFQDVDTPGTALRRAVRAN